MVRPVARRKGLEYLAVILHLRLLARETIARQERQFRAVQPDPRGFLDPLPRHCSDTRPVSAEQLQQPVSRPWSPTPGRAAPSSSADSSRFVRGREFESYSARTVGRRRARRPVRGRRRRSCLRPCDATHRRLRRRPWPPARPCRAPGSPCATIRSPVLLTMPASDSRGTSAICMALISSPTRMVLRSDTPPPGRRDSADRQQHLAAEVAHIRAALRASRRRPCAGTPRRARRSCRRSAPSRPSCRRGCATSVSSISDSLFEHQPPGVEQRAGSLIAQAAADARHHRREISLGDIRQRGPKSTRPPPQGPLRACSGTASRSAAGSAA